MGNWQLHLKTVSEVLHYLEASGHYLYAKSARICLQSMIELKNDYPDVSWMDIMLYVTMIEQDGQDFPKD